MTRILRQVPNMRQAPGTVSQQAPKVPQCGTMQAAILQQNDDPLRQRLQELRIQQERSGGILREEPGDLLPEVAPEYNAEARVGGINPERDRQCRRLPTAGHDPDPQEPCRSRTVEQNSPAPGLRPFYPCYQRGRTYTGTGPAFQFCEANNVVDECDYSRRLLPNTHSGSDTAGQLTAEQFLVIGSNLPHTHIVPAAHGYAFEVQAGTRFRVIDLHGQQVVDFMAWCLPYKQSHEYLSMSYTRHALGGSAPPQVGECLYSNRDEPMFKLTADTVKTHDMLFMACNPGHYRRLGWGEGKQKEARNCATKIAE